MIKGILFDKDGTLIECDHFWIVLCRKVAQQLLNDFSLPYTQELEDAMLLSIGVTGDFAEPTGILASGTNDDIAEAFYKVLIDANFTLDYAAFVEKTLQLAHDYATDDSVEFEPLADLPALFTALKQAGFYIGLATSDTIASASFCLEKLGALHLVDFVGGVGTGWAAKPAPDLMNAFCDFCGIQPNEVMMVGDTQNDMKFAQINGAHGTAVLGYHGHPERFDGLAEYTVGSIAELVELPFFKK